MRKKCLLIITGALATALLFSSCFSLGGSFNPLSGIEQAASNRISAEIISATGLNGMSKKLQFQVLYAQVFYMGGFGAGTYPLEETQGTTWRIKSTDENGTASSVDAERALLKKLPNGDEWWFLAWRSGGDNIEFEGLMDKDQQAKKIRYYNQDTGRIEETVFDEPSKSSSSSDNAAPKEPASGALTQDELGTISKGKETVTVNSGTYTADRMEWTKKDDSNNATYTYTWWVDQTAPGGLVKYNWVKSGSKENIAGELYSTKKGYTTKFSSF